MLSLACLGSDMLGFSPSVDSSVRLYVSTLLFPCDNCQTKLTHKVYNDVCVSVAQRMRRN